MDMETISSPSLSQQPAPQETGRRLHGTALISVITALMLTLLLEALDQTVVGTALPKIVLSAWLGAFWRLADNEPVHCFPCAPGIRSWNRHCPGLCSG